MKNQRSRFSIPAQVTYLNCAYMSPLLKSVEKAGMAGMMKKRNPLEITADEFFRESELLRKEFAGLIGIQDPERIAILPAASYGMANVVKNVKLSRGDTMVVAGGQFPSNYYPWLSLAEETHVKLIAIPAPDVQKDRGKKWNEKILEAINSTTKLVSLGQVHWADGTRFNLEEIRIRTRDVGALLIVDGTQSIGAHPFDIKKIQPDALVCAGYKWLMGPYSTGIAYYGEYFNDGKPIEENWIIRKQSEDFTGLVNYKNEYQEGMVKFDVGERSNFILLPMLLEGIRQVRKWKPEAIQKYCSTISKNAINVLRDNGFWTEEEDHRGAHLFGIRFPDGYSVSRFRERCMKRKIAVSFRGDFLRVSPHVYNDEKDFDKLLEALLP